MKKDRNDDLKKTNIMIHGKQHIRLQTVLFLIIVLLVFLVAIGMRTVFFNLLVKNEYRDVEKLLRNNSKNLEYLINDINSEAEGTSQTYQGVDTLAYSMSARIIIVNTDYNVIYDSFRLMRDTYIMDNDIHRIMSGDEAEKMAADAASIEYMFPVVNREGYTDDVAVVAVSLKDFNDNKTYLEYRANILICIFLVLGVIAAVVISYTAIRDTREIRRQLLNMKDGFLGQLQKTGLWKETGMVVDNMNGIFAKAQLLEESRQEFVSNVSHELKTPITSMKVLSESILMQENVPVETYREFMNDIVHEIDRENQIITDLLTLVKMDKTQANLNISSVKINDLLEVLLKRISPIAEKRGIKIRLETMREVIAEVDEVKLSLACNNLIENAVKYNDDNGSVDVSLNADHKFFYIRVKDTGCGIPEDCQEQIFERFYRVDKARSRETGGTGLGLAITRNVILMHKGSIRVHSKEGEGSTFIIRIPLNYIG